MRFVWLSQREIQGAPSIGDSISTSWSTPILVGVFGIQGEDGDDGIAGTDGIDGTDGIAGADGTDGVAGEDGVGYEYVFAVTAGTSIPNNQRPLNSWGYDEPVARNGLTWYDAAPNVTTTEQYLWRSQRVVIGTPSTGEAITALWTPPTIQSRYSAPGTQGPIGVPGQDGADGAVGGAGAGVEYIFTVYATEALPATRNPDNSWGYDSPGTRGGQVWHDGAPNLTESLPFLYRAERAVTGVPTIGATVTDDWSAPAIVGRYGEAGNGIEFIYATTSVIMPLPTQAILGGMTNLKDLWNDGIPSDYNDNNPSMDCDSYNYRST